MTVKECYEKFNGDYNDVKERFLDDKRIKKFLLLFLKDNYAEKISHAMNEQNWDEAFLNAHTLKGVCANLSLTALFEETKVLTELLRGRCGSDEAFERLETVKAKYILTRSAIEELDDNE